MTWRASEHRYMSRALQLARRGLYSTHPNPCVGCVLVKNDAIVGEGWHQYAGGPHAERVALEQAGPEARDTDCYVTLEPCAHTGRTAPCTEALIAAAVKNIFIASLDPNPLVAGKGVQQLQENGISINTGLLQAQAQALNPGFETRMRHGRPYVRSKLAMSVDGRTAMADGESQWITGDEARLDVQRWRARSAAIMTGSNTVLKDNPALTVRDVDTHGRRPLRVILDRNLRTPPDAKTLDDTAETLIFTLNSHNDVLAALQKRGAGIVVIEAKDDKDFLEQVLYTLAVEKQVNEILLEAGPVLSGAMLAHGLVDELIVYMAPVLLGHQARPLYELPAIRNMQDKMPLEMIETCNIGRDLRLTFRPAQKES